MKAEIKCSKTRKLMEHTDNSHRAANCLHNKLISRYDVAFKAEYIACCATGRQKRVKIFYALKIAFLGQVKQLNSWRIFDLDRR